MHLKHCSSYAVDISYQEGDIRLVGGHFNWEGRVDIFWSGTWSSIRDTAWTDSDTRVVCKQLGHSNVGKWPVWYTFIPLFTYWNGDAIYIVDVLYTFLRIYVPRCCGYYGGGSGPIYIQSVSCLGSEANITSCSNSASTTYDHQYDVGVQCQKGSCDHIYLYAELEVWY